MLHVTVENTAKTKMFCKYNALSWTRFQRQGHTIRIKNQTEKIHFSERTLCETTDRKLCMSGLSFFQLSRQAVGSSMWPSQHVHSG